MMLYLLLLPIVFSIGFWLATGVCVYRFMASSGKSSRRNPPLDNYPAASVIKPVCGLEKNLAENLVTACNQDYPDYEVIYALQDKTDPALDVVNGLRRALKDDTIRVVVDNNEIGVNGKVNNLYNACARARGEVFVISDSDMHLAPDYLRSIVRPMTGGNIDMVCSLYRAWRPSGTLETLELLTYNSDFVPAMIFAYVTGASIVCPGATMAISREALDAVGGWKPLGDYFVEDYELARRLMEKGYRMKLIPYSVNMDVDIPSFHVWWRHQVYWDHNTNSVNFPGFFLTLLVRGVPFALLYTLLGGAHGLPILIGTVGIRLVTGMVNAALLKDIDGFRNIWLLPVRDCFGIFVWLASLFKRHTYWRGKPYILEKGKMKEARLNGSS